MLSLSGTWIGQDQQDLVGPSAVAGPSGVQDIHLALAGVPADLDVVAAEVRALGGGEWLYQGRGGGWAAHFVRSDATRGDIFLEPYQIETGRPFDVLLRYEDGTTAMATIAGGTADPNLRMPGDALQVAWIGQDGRDAVGHGPSVGPDGIQDVRIALGNLTPSQRVTAVHVDGPPGISWSYGTNHEAASNASLDRDPSDPSKAVLSINPDRDLSGHGLNVVVVYASGAIDSALVTAGTSDPALKVAPAPPPPVLVTGASARWLGQDAASPGLVRVAVTGLPTLRRAIAAVLTDEAGLSWVYRADAAASVYEDPFSRPMSLWIAPGGVELAFTPRRDESGTTLTLRLELDDGTTAVARVAGGSVDLGRIMPGPAATSVVAHPGDDLNDLANRYGSVRLAAGRYDLDRPLILNGPVTITADPGAMLVFAQPADSAPWTAAIKVHASHTTLDGFAVRFGGPVRWDQGVSFGPAIIGTTDDRDNRLNVTKVGLTFTHLDVEAPPAASLTPHERAPGLFRLVTAESGRIEANRLRGGMIEFMGGPWQILDNDYRGTVPGTFADAVIAGHGTHDVVVRGNHAEPRGDSGKTWRFLVLTGTGFRDRIEGNTVVGVGPRDDDVIPQANATEIILTESYRLKFEGHPLAVSMDGLIVQVPEPQGGPAQAGDILAILDGPSAGQWRRVVQTLGPQTYLLDGPLPSGAGAISIASGFLGETFRGNTIDTRGSSLAANLMLVGNHFGTQVLDNRLLGGRYGFKVDSSATELPVEWGWSHSPQFGMHLDGNIVIDAVEGSIVQVEHGPNVKSNTRRVYWSGVISKTTFAYTPTYRAGNPQPIALTIGSYASIDPDELVVTLEGSVSRGAASTVLVPAARVNGSTRLDDLISLPLTTPGAPSGLALSRDTGLSDRDSLTSSALLRFDAVPNAAGYEFRVGTDGRYWPLGVTTSFVPEGLADGAHAVYVRAIDEYQARGPESALAFVLDTEAPPAVAGLAAGAGRTLSFEPTGPADIYEYRVSNDGPYRSLGAITRFVPTGLTYGANVVAVRAIDRAGNVGPEATVVVEIALPVLTGRWIGQDGADQVGRGRVAAPDGFRDVHLVLLGLRVDRALASVVVTGLGGGVWTSNPSGNHWRAAVVRSADLGRADVYIQPYQREARRPYRVEIRYEDGTSAGVWIVGGRVDPSRRVPIRPGAPVPAGKLTPLARHRTIAGDWARLRARRLQRPR
jgi:hypothetical protein